MSLATKKNFFYEKYYENHYGLLIVTAIVSIAIHIFLFSRISDLRFDVSADIPEKYRNESDKSFVSFERLHHDPMQPLDVPKFGDPSANPGVGLSSSELSDIIDTPPIEFSAPPPSVEILRSFELKTAPLSEITPQDSVWQPRQDIIEITERFATENIDSFPRHEIFEIDRFDFAPDYAPAVSFVDHLTIPVAAPSSPSPTPSTGISSSPIEIIKELPSPIESIADTIITDKQSTPEIALTPFGEKPSSISEFKPVDSRLAARTTVFSPAKPDGRKYFAIEILPRSQDVLPIVPKDIVFVQDASNSLSDQRLYFCKKGLIESLKFVAPADRFNIVSFRENATFCFANGWARPTPENLNTATTFINSLSASGNTDLFSSLKSLMSLPRDPKRPLIVFVITDGVANKGLTTYTKIIGEFSKLNDNMSLFVVGTKEKLNTYLLDMISFCNRGTKEIVTSGRWDIPSKIQNFVKSYSCPVLGRVGLSSDALSHAEIFPLPSANLYANKTLIYFGSCPEDVNQVVLQVRGEGGETKSDCIFQIDLANAPVGTSAIQKEWTIRKMYTLMGAYARDPKPATLAAIRDLSLASGLPIPYQSELLQR